QVAGGVEPVAGLASTATPSVGASLLAIAVGQLALMLNVPPSSSDRRPEQARSHRVLQVTLKYFRAEDRHQNAAIWSAFSPRM
ncbi:hypothetical protein, partial [Pseudomonas corrugata]|uniref:hypothetical protein n=1 Tax=Pseudomonas corrugata TaxID=47879 RepID=UPI001F516664